MSACCWKIAPLRIFCGLTDKIGCVKSKEGRQCVLGCDACLSVTAIFLVMLSLFGVSSDSDVVKNLAWSQKDNKGFNLYSNLWGVTLKLDTFNDDDDWYYDSCELTYYTGFGWYTVDYCKSKSWDDIVDDINDKKDDTQKTVTFKDGTTVTLNVTNLATALQAEQYAEDCRDAGDGAMQAVIILFIISILGGIRRCIKGRYIEEEDVGKKCSFLLTSLIPVITNIAAIATYQSNCVSSLNDATFEYNSTALQAAAIEQGIPAKTVSQASEILDDMVESAGDWETGPGYGCVIAALVCFITAFFLNLIVPAQPIPDLSKPEGDVNIEVAPGKV